MSIVNLGTEIVECTRVRAMIEEHAERFLTRVYSHDEILWCQSRRNCTEHFAALWAAKEAVFKCLKLAGRSGSPWAHVEIQYVNEEAKVIVRGPLRERMSELGVNRIIVSTAFSRHYATATAIAERA